MIPVLRAAQPAAGGERHLHPDAQRRLRARVRPARTAGRQRGRPGGGHPGRRGPLLPGGRVLLHAAAVAAGTARPTATPAPGRPAVGEAERAVGRRSPSCARGSAFIRSNRAIGWSLLYLGITASLVGVLGVLGPDFAAVGARPRRQGLRGRRPAARVRHRDRDPAAQRVRPVPAAAAGHRGRPDRARRPARGAVGRRPDQPPAPARRRARRVRPVRRDLAAGGRRGHRVRRRDRLRLRRDPVPDAAPGGPARGRPRAASSAC